MSEVIQNIIDQWVFTFWFVIAMIIIAIVVLICFGIKWMYDKIQEESFSEY